MLVNQMCREAGVQGVGNEPVQAEGRQYVEILERDWSEGRGAGWRSEGKEA